MNFPKPINPVPVLSTLLVIAAFFLGSLYTKVQYLEKNKGLAANQPSVQGANAPAPQPTANPGPVEVLTDDDPVLGNANAPVTIIEFSDYECPFCKRHFTDTHGQLKTEYIDTGKAKLIFRDYPLSFHDPLATTEAMAAHCSKEQGGDSTYYKFHDELFKRTTSNGNGLTTDALYAIAKDLGINADTLKTCVESKKYAEEVQKDSAYGNTVGVSGTPTFFIGKSSPNGKITATRLVGAQPFSLFKTAIDAALK